MTRSRAVISTATERRILFFHVSILMSLPLCLATVKVNFRRAGNFRGLFHPRMSRSATSMVMEFWTSSPLALVTMQFRPEPAPIPLEYRSPTSRAAVSLTSFSLETIAALSPC